MLDLDSAVLTTDVLIVGGGPAGTWAAIKARQAGPKRVACTSVSIIHNWTRRSTTGW